MSDAPGLGSPAAGEQKPTAESHWTAVDGIVAVTATVMCLACFLWILSVPTRLGVAILVEQYLAFQLGLALLIVYLRFGWRGQARRHAGWLDSAIAIVCVATLGYAAWDFKWLLLEQSYRPWQITVIGAVVTLAVMEGVRRRAGSALFVIVAAFLIYALFADRVPGELVGKALTPVRLVEYVGFDPNAVFSLPLRVATIVVILFVFFGQLLFAAGGGAFLTDLAMAATARSRGGAAKVAVVGSALFGTVSGSAVSNVVSTGVITIPLMKRAGYSGRDAGAIEAVASTGGQLTPPIMGAAAFLMAEFLEIPYLTVAAAATLPAILFYASVFIQVDLMAGRDGIGRSETGQTAGAVLLKGWHFLFPIAVLLWAMFWLHYDPEESALIACVAVTVVGFLRPYKGERLTLPKFGRVFVETGTSMVDLIMIVAAAGFVIGVLNVTGLGFALTLVLVQTIGSYLFLMLIASAAICTVLGLGMPTGGVYVLLVALIVPSLVKAGIDPLAAHLFILYFGMMSMITPPVALAAFAATTITREDPFATGLAAVRIGWASYIIPFLFVATPPLLLNGTWLQIVASISMSVVGVAAVCAGMVGFLHRRLELPLRVVFCVLGVVALPIGIVPEGWIYLKYASAVACVALSAALILLERAGGGQATRLKVSSKRGGSA